MGQNKSKLDEADLTFWADAIEIEKGVIQEKYQSLASKKGINETDFKEAYHQFFKATLPKVHFYSSF